ncbi:bile acid:sodium symporter family protein [uncultured Chitinophaga sp.]|jgi:Predicted Na+-dependent transporter|uniref:bile acid:sodium symporter family protein n=1 Tax=uncultured Chitinophaga sp. TaxID=339340 RepID=UPI002612AD7E|nr:bile acid:sodium symporter family protein [uncultured Chitinophaga sp.]
MNTYKLSAFLAIAALIAYIVITVLQWHQVGGWLLMLFFAFLAFAFRGNVLLKGFSYTVMIFAAVSLAMYYPQHFIAVGDFKLSKLILPLLQIIMFGMGTGLRWADFQQLAKTPKSIGVGVIAQYSIMPLVGFVITRLFNFPPEIAAGVILIGSCPSGLASNVMSYLAGANLALSVSITVMVTLLAPVITPLWMKALAGQYVEVALWQMMWDIVQIVILPIVAGLAFNHFLRGKFKWLDDAMPLLSMGGIALIIVVVTASGRDSLLKVGPLLIFAALLHNLSGYCLGYWSARLFRMPERDCRTVALEVGMQNGGLASGLALKMGKLATVGLAPAVFGPLMNITGSALATWWKGKKVDDGAEEVAVSLKV